MLSSTFERHVTLKYNLYNSLFITLPIDGIHKTGIRIPILEEQCRDGMQKGLNPVEIMEKFFADQKDLQHFDTQADFMFRIIQYLERQVVLIDALEDAAYESINDLEGIGSFKNLAEKLGQEGRLEELTKELSQFSVRAVLTAHPTQFYPGEVLGIITDLTKAIKTNQLEDIRMLLQQLGKTPFLKKKKPTPLDEAASLVWFLENIFYISAPQLVKKIKHQTHQEDISLTNQSILSFGFWPGGDRDGNPFVDTDTTLKVAEKLKFSVIRNYYRDIRMLRRRLTFRGVTDKLQIIENLLFQFIVQSDESLLTLELLQAKLEEVKTILINQHDGLFVESLINFQNKTKLFGFHFATIDIRQDSRIIESTMRAIQNANPHLKITMEGADTGYEHLLNMTGSIQSTKGMNDVELDTVDSFKVMREIQDSNGPRGCHRYIISNCRNEIDVSNVFALAILNGWEAPFELDIIPLFETIKDLENSESTMSILYNDPIYRAHLNARGGRQTIMLGFSDGTKDGGYLSANWNIYKAKENLTKVSRSLGIEVVFFDGRGGPPARGGGNTHKFYASHGPKIENKEIQLTLQGQTISSNFGTPLSAGYNLELLMSAGLENQLVKDNTKSLGEEAETIIKTLSQISYDEYQRFKAHPKFVPYLEKMSALKYYGMAKIGSRPSKRKASKELKFADLRAIPFVGAWSQLKQNVPGFFGVGTALKALEEKGQLQQCTVLYHQNGFFKALIENSMMSLSKTYFPLTAYMKEDPEFGSFWSWIYKEYLLAKEMVLKVSGQNILLENNEKSRESIELREKIILPLVIIQQYALMQIRQMELSGEIDNNMLQILQKIVVRSLYGNINASRNSA